MTAKTPPRVIQDTELRYHTEGSKRGVFYIRSLSDQDVLDAARDDTSAAHTAIGIHIDPQHLDEPELGDGTGGGGGVGARAHLRRRVLSPGR